MAMSNLLSNAFDGENVQTLQTNRPMTLKLSIQQRGLEPYEVCSTNNPGLALTFFMARSNLVS